MLLPLLLALPAQGIAHAQLHAPDADVFLEIDSAKELFAARERAPFNKLFADEQLQKLCGLLEGFKLPVGPIGEAAFPASLFGETSPFRALRHASVSLGGIDASMADPAHPHLGLEVVLDFADPAAATTALALLDASHWHSSDPALARELAFGEHSCALHWYEGGPGLPLASPHVWIAQDQARVYLGALETTPEQVAARVAGKQPGLPEEARLFADSETLGPSVGSQLYRLWCDIDAHGLFQSPEIASAGQAGQAFARWVIPAILPYVGAKGIWRVEMRGERFITDSVYLRNAAFETKSIGVGAIDATAARFVPKEAVGAWITNIDSPALEGELRSLLGALPAKDQHAPTIPLDELPLLAGGLGTHAACYMLPINSVQALVPRVFLALELKDKAKFEAGLHAWAAQLGELDPALKVVDKEYRKSACVSISVGAQEEPAAAPKPGPFGALSPDTSLNPTIVVLDDRVLFALKKNYAQTETRRISEGKPGEPHALAAPGAIEKDVFEASVMDWGGLFGKLLDIAKGLAPMAAGMLGPDAPQIDPAALPGSATLARYFQPTTSWSKRLPDGRIHTHSESSFGPETPAQIALFVGAASKVMGERAAASPEKTAPLVPARPANVPPTPDKAALQTQSALLLVKDGLTVYRLDSEKLPAKLEQLLVATDRYPDGFLAPEKSVPKDGWGHVLAYKPDADGKHYLLYSFGPDGKDDGGAGDDLKAP